MCSRVVFFNLIKDIIASYSKLNIHFSHRYFFFFLIFLSDEKRGFGFVLLLFCLLFNLM